MRRLLAALLLASLPWSGGAGTETEPDPDGPAEARRERASERLLAGDPEAALSLCGEVLAEAPDDEACALVRARSRIALGRTREALREAREFAAARPGSEGARAILGEALYRAGHLAEALSVLEPLAGCERPLARPLVFLGLLRAGAGDDDDAAALLDRALALDPGDRDVLFHASEAAPTRARAVELLEKYLAIARGDDPDRIEAARGTLRVYRALGERAVWIAEARPERVEVPLFPLPGKEGRNRGYLIHADLGQKKKTPLLLDTGSGGLFLLERVARKAGWAPLAGETVFAGGGEGRQASERGLLPSLAVGGLKIRDALVSTTRSEIEPTGRYHGILGLSAFRGYVVTIDLDAGRLVLEKPREGPRGARYWTVSGQMLVEGEIERAGPGLFLLDTGASRSQVAASRVAEIPEASVGPPIRVSGYGGAMPGARTLRRVRATIPGAGPLPAELLLVDLAMRSRLGGVEVSGTVGLDVLDGRRIVVDAAARRVEIAPPPPR